MTTVFSLMQGRGSGSLRFDPEAKDQLFPERLCHVCDIMSLAPGPAEHGVTRQLTMAYRGVHVRYP